MIAALTPVVNMLWAGSSARVDFYLLYDHPTEAGNLVRWAVTMLAYNLFPALIVTAIYLYPRLAKSWLLILFVAYAWVMVADNILTYSQTEARRYLAVIIAGLVGWDYLRKSLSRLRDSLIDTYEY